MTPGKTLFDRAVHAQQASAFIQKQVQALRTLYPAVVLPLFCRVRGALGKEKGRLKGLSSGVSMLLWWGATGYTALAVFAVWMGLRYGGIVSLMPAMLMDLHGARAVSSTIGVLYTGAALGNVAGPGWPAGCSMRRAATPR